MERTKFMVHPLGREFERLMLYSTGNTADDPEKSRSLDRNP